MQLLQSKVNTKTTLAAILCQALQLSSRCQCFCAKADSTLRSSRAVPHPSTNRALRRLTSEVGRDPVYSTRYGRQRMHWVENVTKKLQVGRPILPSTGSIEHGCCNVLCCGMLPQVYGCLAVVPFVCILLGEFLPACRLGLLFGFIWIAMLQQLS